MLSFFSASARIVNSRRAITEVLEASLEGASFDEISVAVIHASIGHNFEEIAEEASKLLPNARILGASCCGVVGTEGVSESMKDIAVMAVKGTEYAVASCDEIYGHNSYEKCLELAKQIKAEQAGTNMVYFLASGIDISNDECIKAFEEILGKDVTIFGATSSDNMKGYISYQIVDDQVLEHGAFAIGFADPTLEVETQATHGFVAIGEPMVVTRAKGNVIYELNGKPAWQEYLRLLGLNAPADCGDTIPIGALGERLSDELAEEYGNRHILRVVTKFGDDDSIYYATTIEEGTELWLTTRDEELIFTEMDRLTKNISDKLTDRETVAVFHADCLARGRSLFGRIMKEELVAKMQVPFYNGDTCPPWLGMYGFGEFARLGGENEYHNYTSALYVLHRKK